LRTVRSSPPTPITPAGICRRPRRPAHLHAQTARTHPDPSPSN